MRTKIAVAVTAAVTITINVLANIIPYNNKTTAQISDSFPVYFVPAGYVFSIWGLIYIGLIAYVIYRFKFAKPEFEKTFKEIDSWFIIGCLANSVWIFLWHYEYIVATTFMMLLLLISLLGIYLEIKKNSKMIVAKKDFWMFKAPFSIYLGWISVATVANLSSVLYTLGFSGGDYALWWAVAMMIVAGILGLLMVLREKDLLYAGVIVWALVGIGVKFPLVTQMVWTAGIIVGLLVIASIVAKVYKKNKK